MTAARQLTGTAARPCRVAGLAALRTEASAATGRRRVPEVLLLPGFTGSKEDFAPVLDELAAAGYGVTTVDLPGQYESPGSEDLAAYSPDALAQVVRSLLDAVGGTTPVHLVGHSFGGLVARAGVLADPARVASLVLIGSGPAAIGGRRRATLELLEPVLPAVGLAGLYERMEQLSAQVPGYEPPSPELAEFLRHRFLVSSSAMLQGMGLALRTEPDRTSELAATGVPVLVMHGVDDDAWPPAVQADMAARLGALHAAVPDAAHSPAAENPAATVAALLSFWQAVERS